MVARWKKAGYKVNHAPVWSVYQAPLPPWRRVPETPDVQGPRDPLRSRQQDGFRSASARRSVLRRARGELLCGAGVERLVRRTGAVGSHPVLRRLVHPWRHAALRFPSCPFHAPFERYVREPGKGGGRPLAVTHISSPVSEPYGEAARGNPKRPFGVSELMRSPLALPVERAGDSAGGRRRACGIPT